MVNYKNVDEYILSFPETTQEILNNLREFLNTNFPQTEETINYAMPTLKLNGNLVHYAAYKNHIGFYPGASGVANFTSKLTDYKTSKGAIQFPIEKPIPFELIKEITEFRVIENLSIVKKKK